MAVRWAVSNGNWSATATWDGGTLPGVADDVYADGKTVTVDISAQCLSVRTQQRSGGTAGGSFTLSDGVVLAADAIAGTTSCILYHGTASATLAGNAYGGNASDAYGASSSGVGLLVTTGNSYGGSGGSSIGARNGSAGSIRVMGNSYGGSGSSAQGAANFSTGTLDVWLNTYGGGSNAAGVHSASVGVVTVGLNSYGGEGAGSTGAYNGGAGSLTIAGKAVGNGYPITALSPSPGVQTSAGGNPCVIGGIEYGPYGQSPTDGRVYFSNPAPAGAIGWTSAGVPVPIGDASGFEFPAESDVRANTVFANGVYTGTCAVPVASTVLAGVPTDDAVGTLVAEIDTLALTDATADLVALLSWLTPVIPEVPAVVIPGPTQPTATVAWCYCFDEHGAPKEGVVINLFARSTGTIGNTYTPILFTAVSDAQGIARVEVPRDPLVRFMAYRGGSTRRVQFTGVDADTLQMPSMLGEP